MFISTLVLSNDPMTKFGHDSLNFAKMFTLAIYANRENFAFFDNIWLPSNLKSLKSSKLPIYDTFASLLCLVRVLFFLQYLKILCSQVCFFSSRMYAFVITNSIFDWLLYLTMQIVHPEAKIDLFRF